MSSWMSLAGLAAVLLLLSRGDAAPLAPDPADLQEGSVGAWGRVLAAYEHDGGLDYAALQAHREDLDLYVHSLEEARPGQGRKDEQLAFWINAYNAVVAFQVLEHYPELESVKEIPGFFDGVTFPVAGAELTLDEIESRGRDLGDARIHFAVVCASTSCPDLRGEPYRARMLDRQLEEQTRQFLADPTKGARYEADDNELWLSSIFKWYAGDFTGGSTVVAFFFRGGVLDWVLGYLPEEVATQVRERDPTLRYLDYDWGLNDRPRE